PSTVCVSSQHRQRQFPAPSSSVPSTVYVSSQHRLRQFPAPSASVPSTVSVSSHHRLRQFRASARQLPVFDPVRLIRRRAEAALPIGFVILIVPFEPHHLAVAFERQ